MSRCVYSFPPLSIFIFVLTSAIYLVAKKGILDAKDINYLNANHRPIKCA